MDRTPRPIEIDTLPFAGMMLLLIPMLLASVQFAAIATIDAAQPAIADGTSPPDATSLHLTVGLHDRGYTISARDGALVELGWDGPREIPLAVDGHDVSALSEAMREVKRAWPDEVDLILSPGDAVPFEVLVATMDATREDAHGALFPRVALAAVKE